ncbi:unnamed protein product [Caenorhabditis bovis]|uniref:Uncharacterized protein n=1 Tax=Caenorhabditis bovis TaxID=2654633 RepID=A0A8S1EV32_9PELO|nr:unnamed protein product [Caenorhabditis bovis]
MSHQAPHYGVQKKMRMLNGIGAIRKPSIDESANRIWTIGHIIYQRSLDSKSRSSHNDGTDSIDFIDATPWKSER